MAKQDLTMIYIRTKRDVEGAIAMIRKHSNLPAYLFAGIIDGISESIHREMLFELSASADSYIKELEKELKPKEADANERNDE